MSLFQLEFVTSYLLMRKITSQLQLSHITLKWSHGRKGINIFIAKIKKKKIANYVLPEHHRSKGLPRWGSSKESACQCRRHKRHWFDPWAGKIPWSKKWQLTSVFLPGKFHEQRSLVGCSPWGCKESNAPECTHAHTQLQRLSFLERPKPWTPLLGKVFLSWRKGYGS